MYESFSKNMKNMLRIYRKARSPHITCIQPNFYYPRLFFDGCSKGNSGFAGAGAHILVPDSTINLDSGHITVPYSFLLHQSLPGYSEIWADSKYLGSSVTNNCAEYSALILGLEAAIENQIDTLDVYGDSILVIQQMKNFYKVKNPNLLSLHEKASLLSKHFHSITYTHVLRQHNKRADSLANNALQNIP